MTDDVTEEEPQLDSSAETTDDTTAGAPAGPAPQYGVGPFSIREVALAGVWLVAFVVSFFSLSTLRFDSVWTSGLLWILTIGLPTVAVFLIVLRRLSPDGIRRVGSLGIDQFASVAFSVSSLLWLQLIWETVSFVVADGPWVRSWVMWLEFVLMLAGVVLTVFAPILPVLGEDFRDRREVPAHRNARPIRAVEPRPKPEPRPEPDEQQAAFAPNPYEAGTYDTGAYEAAAYDTGGYQPVGSDTGGYAPVAYDQAAADDVAYDVDQTVVSGRTGSAANGWAPPAGSSGAASSTPIDTSPEPAVAAVQPAQQHAVHQPFWALAPAERDVYDAQGSPLFRIGPTAWALVIEDRGTVYVVRHEDGRIGYLHDVSGVTRG